MIKFNQAYSTGRELKYIKDILESKGQISGNGHYTKSCQSFFENRYGFNRCLFTNSCTAALEMAALLINIQPGDEVILPSYTFPSTANAFLSRGAKLVFCDSSESNPNISIPHLESLISSKTKAIVPVHYAGEACKMDEIMRLANKNGIFVIEDAAQAINSFYNDRPLGSIGHMGAFSFHETKNVHCGEGGMLVINDQRFIDKAEIIWEKGTNRAAFMRGEIDTYEWVGMGSSSLPSDLSAAYLWAQLEHLDQIQIERVRLHEKYRSELSFKTDRFILPPSPKYGSTNGHMFYLVCPCLEERNNMISFLKKAGISASFHYQSLHKSPFYSAKHDGTELTRSDYYMNGIVRLPMYYGLTDEEQDKVIATIRDFCID